MNSLPLFFVKPFPVACPFEVSCEGDIYLQVLQHLRETYKSSHLNFIRFTNNVCKSAGLTEDDANDILLSIDNYACSSSENKAIIQMLLQYYFGAHNHLAWQN